MWICIRKVHDTYLASERYQVVFAQAVDRNVPDNHHFVVILIENSIGNHV